MRRVRGWLLITTAGIGSVVFQGCPAGGLVTGFLSGCFGKDTISQSEYNDLNVLEQLLYQKNDCGRYEPRSISLAGLL